MPRTYTPENEYQKLGMIKHLIELGREDPYYLQIARLRQYMLAYNVNEVELAEYMDTTVDIVMKFLHGKGRKAPTVPRVSDFELAIESFVDRRDAGLYVGRTEWPIPKKRYDITQE